MAVAVGQPVSYRPGKNGSSDLLSAIITRVNTAGNPGNVDLFVMDDTTRTTRFVQRATWRASDNGNGDLCFPIASLS